MNERKTLKQFTDMYIPSNAKIRVINHNITVFEGTVDQFYYYGSEHFNLIVYTVASYNNIVCLGCREKENDDTETKEEIQQEECCEWYRDMYNWDTECGHTYMTYVKSDNSVNIIEKDGEDYCPWCGKKIYYNDKSNL